MAHPKEFAEGLSIGIIMDGNGRWAKNRGLPRTAGHKRGAEVFSDIADYCDELGVSSVYFYAFSTENWKRPLWNRLHRPSTMRLPPSGVPFRMLLRSRTTRPDDLKCPPRKLRTLSRKYYFICKTGNDCGHFLFCFFTRKSVPINCIKMPPAS